MTSTSRSRAAGSHQIPRLIALLSARTFPRQAVILLPFIDEARLTAAMAPQLVALDADERRRNSHGATLLFAALGRASVAKVT